ncbi:hypothetical protein [Nonomuraea sp. NPDC049784]|uniref:hypothetical protein n=1 Tax=Nonomuraea sp. NPDC049784 TaxID=3154361 RepID=UPI0033C467EC
MTRLHLRKRGWITVGVIATVAVLGTTGLSIANNYSNVSNETVCAVWDDPGSQGYQECLDNLNGTQAGGLVPGAQAGKPSVSATSTGNPRPLMYFCRDKGKSHLAATKPVKGCADQLKCLYKANDRKYHCMDGKGIPASPPGNVCKVNPNFACADEVVVATPLGVEPDNTTHSTNSSTQTALPPKTAEPTNQALPDAPSTTSPTPTSTASPAATPSGSPSATIAADDPVGQALLQTKQRNLRVWLESDLVSVWSKGTDQLQAAANRLKIYATQPGVVGVKIAYDLGLRGPTTSDETVRFVTETAQILRATLPAGRQIAVDVVIPELGCGGHETCVKAMQTAHPQATVETVQRYVTSGNIDALNITAGLFTAEYAKFGIQPADAIKNTWLRIRTDPNLRWKNAMPGLFLGSRDIGLAHEGNTSPLTAAAANKLVHERVDAPLRSGADHVILWTWRQKFKGDDGREQTWRLADVEGQANAICNALRARQRMLSIAYDPRDSETGIAGDIATIAKIASSIFMFVP